MENFSIKIDENVRLRLYKICRLCGDDSPNNTDILANNKKSTNVDPNFHKKIFDCIGIQVTKGDKMPQTACNVCREKINDFFDFREMCLATDVQTRRLLGLPDTVVPKPDPALDTIEDDKTEVEKTIKKKNPVAIKALKSGKVLKSEKRSAIELRKGSLDGRRSFPETRRSSLQENKKTALPDIKKAPPDIRKGPPETRKNQVEIKKGPPETRRSLLESRNKTTKPEVKKIPPDVKKPPVDVKKPPPDVKKPIVEVKKPPADMKKPPVDAKKSLAEVKKAPLEMKKNVKLEREKALLKLKKKVQISVHQLSNAELKKKFKDDPDRLARAKKRKASGDLLTEKPPNKRERLRDTIIKKFNNPEIALDTVATNVKCKICSKPFCNAGELHRHLDTDHLPRVVTFHCIRCNESLEKKQDIKDHNLWHKLSKTPYECGRCTKTITNLAVYTKHVQNCSGFIQDFEYKTKVCPTCKEEFQTQNLYNWHKCIINQLKCEVCQQKFTKRAAMVKHVVRCSAIGLNTSLPVVDSAIEPDPEPETEPPPDMNDHFGDDDGDDSDDAEMYLKPNLEIDIEVPREEPEPEPEKEEEKEAAPFVVIPPPAASAEISRPSSNSSSSVAAASSRPSRAPSVHSNIADDDASNASSGQTGNVVMPMVCIKFESTLRNVVPAETNNQTTSNAAVRVKAEVVDTAYRGLYDNTTGQNIKVEQNTEVEPESGAPSPAHSAAAASDNMDEPMDDLPDGGASSRSVTPPPSPAPETNPTPLPKPTLKLVIKKQHGTLNSSFVEGSDVPRDGSEPHPKKKKKKKAKIFKIPKGLALRLRQEKIQSGIDEGNDEGNDDASSGTNNENDEEEEHPQDTLPVISNVCSKYEDRNTEKHAGHVPVDDAVQVRIKQERLDNDDDVENPATEESTSGPVTEEQEDEEEEAAQNALPVISKVFSKHSKAKSKVKKPVNSRLDATVQIKQERLDEQPNSISDISSECDVAEVRIKRERVENDDEVSSNSNICENVTAQIRIKQEREDVENVANSSVGEPTENNGTEHSQSIRQKPRENIKMATRHSRPKRNDRMSENLVVGNVQIKQETLDEADSESRVIATPAAESNEDEQEEINPALNKTRTKLSKPPKRMEVNPAKKKTLNTDVRIKQERVDTDIASDVQRITTDGNTQNTPESVDINLEKRPGRSLRNKVATNVSVRIKEERIDNDEAETETEEQDSNVSNENLIVPVSDKLTPNDKRTRNTSDFTDIPVENRRGGSLRNKEVSDVNVRVKEERIDSDEAEAEVDEHDSDITNVSPVLDKCTSRGKRTRNATGYIDNKVEKPRGKNIGNEQVSDVNVRVKEERIDSDEAEAEVDEHDSDISNESPVLDKSTSRDKGIRNTLLTIDKLDKPRGKSLRNQQISDINVRVKEERIDSDEAEATADEHNSNISNESPVLDRSTSRDKRIRNTSITVDNKAEKPRGRNLRNEQVSDVFVRVKEERIDSDEAEAEVDEHDSDISNESPVLDKCTSRGKRTQNATGTIDNKVEKPRGKNIGNKQVSDVSVRVKEERIDSDEAETDQHNSDISDEAPAVPVLDKTILSGTESASSQPRASAFNDVSKVRIKEENMDSEDDEENADDDLALSATAPIPSTKKKLPSKPKSKKSSGQECANIPAVDASVCVKQERVNTEEPEINPSSVLPVISQVFSQHIKSEDDQNNRQEKSTANTIQENVRIKQEKNDNAICIIDSDDEDDEVVVAQRPNIPVINLLSPDRSDPDPEERTCENIEASSSVPENVRVKEERVDRDESNVITDVDTEENAAASSSPLRDMRQVNDNSLDQSIRKAKNSNDASNAASISVEKSKKVVQPLRKKMVKNVFAVKPPTLTSEVTEKSASKRPNKAIDDVPIKEEKLDEEDDDEVQLVDLTEVIEIPDESVPVIAQPQAKRQKVNNQNSTASQIEHEDPGGLVRIKEELPELQECDQDIDRNAINSPTTVINPLAARLKRLSRKRKNINPLNPANLGLLQTRIKRERVDGSCEGSPVADRLDRTSLEESNMSSSSVDSVREIEVNEINSERAFVRVKEEPVENTLSHDELESNASSVSNKIPSKNNSKGKGTGKEIVSTTVRKAPETLVKYTAPDISKTVNTRQDLPEKSVPNSDEPMPMLRIKSEFSTFNFNNEENSRTSVDNRSNPDIVMESEARTDGLVIKEEPIFDGSVKEELADSDDDETEESQCDAEIKEELPEFCATEEMQSPLLEGSNLEEAQEPIDNTLNKGPVVVVDTTKTKSTPDYFTESNVSEETSERSTEEASCAIETPQQVLIPSKAHSGVKDNVLENQPLLKSIMIEKGQIAGNTEMDVTNMNLEVSSGQSADQNKEEHAFERTSISESVVEGKTLMEDEKSIENASLPLEVSSGNNVYLSSEGQSLSDSVVDEKTCMEEHLNLEISSGQKNENNELQMESPSILANLEDQQGSYDTMHPTEILTDGSNISSTNCQIPEPPPVDEVSSLIEKSIETPVIPSNASSEMMDLSQIEKMNVDHVQEDICDKGVPSTDTASYDCEIEPQEQALPPISTDLTTEVNEVTNVEASAENIFDKGNQISQCISTEVGIVQNPTVSNENVTKDEHGKILTEEKCLKITDAIQPMSIDASLENLSSTEQKPNDYNQESSTLSTENAQSHSHVDQNVVIASEHIIASEDVSKSDRPEYHVQDGDINVHADFSHSNKDATNEYNTTNIEADNSMNPSINIEGNNSINPSTDIEAGNSIHEHISNEENTTNDTNSQHVYICEKENTQKDDHFLDGKIDVNEQSISAEDANTEETESDEKITDYDNVTQESENVDECSEMEDSENIEDSPENDSDSNCNQKLKDLIKNNDNLLGFFEHELSRNNDSCSEERSMDQSTRDQGADSPIETVENLKEDSKSQNDSGNSVNSESTVENQSNNLESAHEGQCEKDQSIEDRNNKSETTESNISSEMDVSKDHVVTDDSNVASSCSTSFGSGPKSNLSEPSTTVAGTIDDPSINLPINPFPHTIQTCSQPLQTAQHLNPPVNFSINTLMGSALGPSSSTHSIPITPSITALPRAIVSPTISPSISSYNAPPLNVLDRIPPIPFTAPQLGGNTFNSSGNPISSLHSIESPNNLSVIPPFVSSNIINPLPTSPPTQSAFPNTSGQPAFSSRLFNESPSHLNMLHINEIAENNNNANIERELQNDLESISSNSNMDFDETTANSVSDVSETNALTNASNIDNAELDH